MAPWCTAALPALRQFRGCRLVSACGSIASLLSMKRTAFVPGLGHGCTLRLSCSLGLEDASSPGLLSCASPLLELPEPQLLFVTKKRNALGGKLSASVGGPGGETFWQSSTDWCQLESKPRRKESSSLDRGGTAAGGVSHFCIAGANKRPSPLVSFY